MEKKKKPRFSKSETMFDRLYDSDKDLTKAEQQEIQNSPTPKETREKTWEKKGLWKKTKRALKAGFKGDKRKEKKPYGQ